MRRRDLVATVEPDRPDSQDRLRPAGGDAGTSPLLQATTSAYLYPVLVGWAFRHKSLPDGRRQILNVAVPSDFLGLQGTVANEMLGACEERVEFPRGTPVVERVGRAVEDAHDQRTVADVVGLLAQLEHGDTDGHGVRR